MNTRQSGFSHVMILLVVLILAVIGFTAWRVFAKDSPTQQGSNAGTTTAKTENTATEVTVTPFTLPAGWQWYENESDGFKIAYPAAWGSPSNYNKFDGTTGSEYTLSFTPGPAYSYTLDFPISTASRSRIQVLFASKDFTTSAERNNTRGPFANQADIKKVLGMSDAAYAASGNGNTRVYNDKSSYVVLTDNVDKGSTSVLGAYALTAVTSLNVDAAYADYTISDRPDDCAVNKLSDNSRAWCMNESIQDELLQSLRSLRSL